jgi:hypothetical protein
MNRKKKLLLGLLLASNTLFWAQESPTQLTEEMRKFQIKSISLLVGGINSESTSTESVANNTSYDVAPTLENSTNNYSYVSKSGGAFGAYINLNPLKKSKLGYNLNQEIRLGVQMHSRNFGFANDRKTNLLYTDTLTSTTSGTTYYRNFVNTKNNQRSLNAKVLSLDVAYLLKTSNEHWVRLYGGIGIKAGILTHTRLSVINSIENGYTNTFDTNIIGLGFDRLSVANEYKFKSKMIYSTYLPFGVDVAWGEPNKFRKRLHTSLEFRPSLELYDKNIISNISTHFGLSFDLN